MPDLELADLCLDPNDWYVRHARRILQERTVDRELDPVARLRLVDIATTHPDASRRLRATWALHVTGQLGAELIEELLSYHNEYIRAWAVQLALDNDQIDERRLLPRFATMAEQDPSPVVRLYLASAAGRLPIEDRWETLTGLVSHADDSDDQNLPLMIWYAAEPLAELDPARALAFGLSCGETIPMLRDFMLRRIGSLDTDAARDLLVRAIGNSDNEEVQLTLLRGLRSSLRGRRQVESPKTWDDVFPDLMETTSKDVRSEAIALGVAFGDRQAMETLRHVAASPQNDIATRRDALDALLAARDPQLSAVLRDMLDEPSLRGAAIRGLASYDDRKTSDAVLAVYADLPPAEKQAALATLASRPAYAKQMLDAISDGKIQTSDLTADLVRQLHNLGDDDIDARINDIWGQVRSTPADKQELIAQYRKLVTESPEGTANLKLGRAVFAKTCGQCHTLYGSGSDIGPDLTGSNRTDLEYLLSNVVDPGGLIAKEYQSTLIITMDGRVVTGVISAEDDSFVTIRNATDTLVIPKEEIDERELSNVSLMPDDQLKQYSDREVVSLFAYLMGKSQVPMLATKENEPLLFNGRDLALWHGDSRLWSVEDGEIVGRSPGISHNSFLVSDLWAKDFRLTLEVKLIDNLGNSGIQFRSEPIHGFEEVRGYQADIGPDWWGKLYEEHGRELLWGESGEPHIHPGEWNKYEILAEGSRIRTWINGQPCVDLDDPSGAKQGVFALQIHSGGPMEVRFRNLDLQILTDESSD